MLRKIKNINPYLSLNFDWNLYKEVWCNTCSNEWYLGRIAAIETFEVTDNIKNLIYKGATDLEIFQKARENKFLTMKEDAYIKVLKWFTTISEIRRVLN
jgi:type II secretory ATPase GspE/PulE/Tfp pilus assembly ATPase PilB-like protein